MERLHCDICDTFPAESSIRVYMSSAATPELPAGQVRAIRRVVADIGTVNNERQDPKHLCRKCWKTFLTHAMENISC